MRVPAADRFFAVLGYLPFLFWLPIVVKRESMFCQFHGRQSMVLWGLWLAPIVVLAILLWPLASLDVWIIGAIFVLTGLYLLMALVGIFKAALRERYRMPVVADVALLLRL